MNSRPSSLLFLLLPLLLLAVACGGANASVETGGNERSAGEAREATPTTTSNDPITAPSETVCADAEKIPACDDVAVETMSGDDVVNQWDSLEGQTVHVLGRLMINRGMCTEQYCGPENPCCNSCGGQLTFDFTGQVVLDDSEQRFDCDGDSCGLCCGYAVPNENVRTSGRPGVDAHGQRHLFDTVVCIP